MQVKRFFGPDTKSVLRQIREIPGEEAMISSNKQIDNGVEILCVMESAGEADSYQSQSYDNVKVMGPTQSLSALLEQLSYATLILIDTPSAINNRLYCMEQLKNAENNGYAVKKLLTVSSLQQQKNLQNQIEFFNNYQLDDWIITRIDEAISLGESLGMAIENYLPIGHTTNGEQVPEDIHIPDANRLIKKCWALGSLKESSSSKDSLAIRLLTEAVEL